MPCERSEPGGSRPAARLILTIGALLFYLEILSETFVHTAPPEYGDSADGPVVQRLLETRFQQLRAALLAHHAPIRASKCDHSLTLSGTIGGAPHLDTTRYYAPISLIGSLLL